MTGVGSFIFSANDEVYHAVSAANVESSRCEAWRVSSTRARELALTSSSGCSFQADL